MSRVSRPDDRPRPAPMAPGWGPYITFQDKAKDKKVAARMVAKAQAKVLELQANQASADDFGCD